MAEQMGTPGSNADLSVNGTLKAAKDKACPFCSQQFTSSSLGRHLDLYVKEKNPKAADGVHDVDEIRKMRGGITRRQPRTSTSRREDSTPAGTPAQERRSPHPESDRQDNESPTLRRDDSSVGDTANSKGKPNYFINKATWEATGVMNNIPQPRVSDARSWDGEERDTNRRLEPRSRSVSKQMLAKTTFEQKQKMIDALDNAKAAELALRELLGSIRAARTRIDGPSIFDYDPLQLDFPSLCLQCLPPPPTLFQSTCVPSPASWSILPPDETQYHALVSHFSTVFHNWSMSVAVATTVQMDDLSYPPPQAMFGVEDPAEIVQRAEATAADLQTKISSHLHQVFGHWTSLPAAKRSELWTLELARGIGRKSGEVEKLKKERDFHKQEAAHMKQQVEELSRLQHPREYKLTPPTTIPVDASLLSALVAQGLNSAYTGFTMMDRDVPIEAVMERAIGRWKSVVKEARGNGAGLAAQRSLSAGSAHSAGLPAQPPSQVQQQAQSNPATTIASPQPTPTIAMDSSNLSSGGGTANGLDGMGSDADADADADMEDDDSYVEMNDMQRAPEAQMASNNGTSTNFRLGNGQQRGSLGSNMEGLESQVVQGYVRIGA